MVATVFANAIRSFSPLQLLAGMDNVEEVEIVWEAEGPAALPHRNGTPQKEWWHSSVQLPMDVTINTLYLVAVRGKGPRGDILVDKLRVYDGICSGILGKRGPIGCCPWY